MNEQLQCWWEIEVDYIVKERDIDTTGSQVSDYQKVHLLLSEQCQPLFTGALVHGTIYEGALEASLDRKLIHILHMIACGPEDDGLLVGIRILNQLPHDIHQGSCLFT